MAAGLGAESLAARFKAGDGLEGYLGRWLLLARGGGWGCGSGGQSGHEPPDPAHPHRRGREAEHGGHRHELVPLQKNELQGKTEGSRQSTTVQLPTAILRNMGVYPKFIDSVRADESDMNQLLVAAWDGLRSRTAIGHWAKRGK